MAWTQALCVVLLTGLVSAITYNTTYNVGDSLPVQVLVFSQNVPCAIKTPQGDIIEFKPEDHSTDRIVYNDQAPVFCAAIIRNLTENDEGEWTIYIDENNKATYILTIQKAEENEGNSQEVPETEQIDLSEEDNTEWLTEIHHITRTGLTVDISLSKKPEINALETFTITTPQNEVIPLDQNNIDGLTVHGSSVFVASRVTVGPMEPSLIGRWTLCGEITEGGPAKRCQSVTITWNTLANPSAEWDIRKSAIRDTVTNYMAIVDATVQGLGNLITCHLLTPENEDLVLTSTSDYPGLTRVQTHESAACRVNIGPIQKEFIGDWILYARFRPIVGSVFEVRLPLYLFLYDEENPYNQAYNVTTLDPVTRVVNLGTSTDLEISGSGTTDDCEVRSPAGQTFNLMNAAEPVSFNTAHSTACVISLGPISEQTLGDWEIAGKFSNRGVFTERRQTIRIIQEDPENPIIEDHRIIKTKDEVFLNTTLGTVHSIVTVPDYWIFTQESCHLRTPAGRQYTIMDGFSIPGVEVVEDATNGCGVKINVSEDTIGEWTLISREQHVSEAVEIRLPFTVHVEEQIDASANYIVISEGNDLHVRLANPTDLHESCKLFNPKGIERTDVEIDSGKIDTCGFIVRNVQNKDSGVWQIRYGTGVSYRANIDVLVKDSTEFDKDSLVLTLGSSVNETIGPEAAVYCRLSDPSGRMIFEAFGRCNLVLDRVTNDHAGLWTMTAGLVGKMLTKKYYLEVEVRGLTDKPTVTTHVSKQRPEVILSCSVPVNYEVRSCLFREPSGQVIVASEGLTEDRFIFHGSGTTFDANVTTHECGLRITNPVTADLGLWRCAVQTDHEVYYGFLSVICPWAMQDPATAASVITEPTLTANKLEITRLEGDSLTMSCSIQSHIRYCYFRASNGTVFNVSPGLSTTNYEYAGAGLDAGECGIRFGSLAASDEGRWSCHVGLPDSKQPEQRVNMQVQIHRRIIVSQYVAKGGVRIIGEVYQYQPLEYCRYVRMDGLGFTKDTLPDSRYFVFEDPARGYCGLNIENPTVLEMHPWTIAARIVGHDDEVSGVTNHTIQMPTTPSNNSINFFLMWTLMIFAGVLLIVVGILLIPAKNRQKTMAKATAWRQSVRRSFQKMPLPDDANRNSPMSA